LTVRCAPLYRSHSPITRVDDEVASTHDTGCINAFGLVAGCGVGVQTPKCLFTAPLLVVALGLLLSGCAIPFWDFDPLVAAPENGRPPDFATMMRVGAAAHAGGDLTTAAGVYRQAAALDPLSPAPLVAEGNTLLEMAEVNDAIAAYRSALARNDHEPEALRGLARAFLVTGQPELAGEPLAIAYRETPDDPKLLQLIGVADDFAGQHEEAQARYRRGLELLPHDRALSLNLAMSLALTGNFGEAVAVLHPIATARGSTQRERLTLALIYGLQGNRPAAAQIAAADLDHEAVERNLAYYDDLRRLPPAARQRAIQTLSTQSAPNRS